MSCLTANISSSQSCTRLQSRGIHFCEPKQRWAPTAPSRSLTCVPAALFRQPSRYHAPLQLSSVLTQSAMERHKTPFICPLLWVQLLEVFLFLSQSHYSHYCKLISYTERALSAGQRRQEAAAHLSHDGLARRWIAWAIVRPRSLAGASGKSWVCTALQGKPFSLFT